LTGHVLGLDEIEADQARDNFGYGHDTEAESKEIDALRVKLIDADSKVPSLVTDEERESVAAMRAKFNTLVTYQANREIRESEGSDE
jgi:hypothetical protein